MQRRMRQLRHKHNISTQELAGHSNVSVQRLSFIELNNTPVTDHTSRLVEFAFRRYLLQKRNELFQLENDLMNYRKHLLDQIEEDEDT